MNPTAPAKSVLREPNRGRRKAQLPTPAWRVRTVADGPGGAFEFAAIVIGLMASLTGNRQCLSSPAAAPGMGVCLNSLGLQPVWSRKARLKCDRLLNPQDSAM